MTRDATQLSILDDLKKSLEESAKESGLQNMKSDLHTEEEDNKGKEEGNPNPNPDDDDKNKETNPNPDENNGDGNGGENKGKEESGEDKNKQTDDKNKGEVDKSKTDDKSKTTTDEKPLDERVEELIAAEPPGGSHASAKTVASWKEATKTIAELKEIKANLAKELETAKAEVEKAKTSKEVPAQLKEELEYLRQKVAEVDYAALPEVKETYDKPIAKAQDQIIALFEKAEKEGRPQAKGIVEKLKATISEYGLFGLDWDGLLTACGTPAKEGEKTVLTVAERKAIESTLGTALALQQRKTEAIKEAKGTYEAKLKTEQEKAEQEKVQRQEHAKEYAKGLDSAIRSTVEKNPALQEPKDPGNKATPEQKAAFIEAQKAYDEKKTLFNKYAVAILRSQGLGIEGMESIPDLQPQEFFDIFAGYVNSKEAQNTINTLNAKVAELEKKLDDYKSGSSTTPTRSNSGSVASTPPAPAQPSTPAEAREALRKSAAAAFGA